jgi:plastocyanin
MKTLTQLVTIGALGVVALLGGCVGEGDPSLAPANPGISNEAMTPVQVSVDNFTFKPDVVTVPAGGSVVWTNRDDVPHTVKAADKSFTSPALDTDEAFTRVFPAKGEYAYFCSIHPHMTGRVIVK